MDLSQSKLTKAEWLNVEIPVVDTEKIILDLILEGYHDVSLRKNSTPTLYSIMKLGPILNIHEYLYDSYFDEIVKDICKSSKSISLAFVINIP